MSSPITLPYSKVLKPTIVPELAAINAGIRINLPNTFPFTIPKIPPTFVLSFLFSLSGSLIHPQDMAHHHDKEKPPAYTKDDHKAPTRGGHVQRPTAPNHSTRASLLSGNINNMTPQYLDLTFSILVRCRETFAPIVVAIDDDYDTLLNDFDYIFCQILRRMDRPLKLHSMRVVWENGWKESWSSVGSDKFNREWHSTVKADNLLAMLRLLKSKNDMSYIEVH